LKSERSAREEDMYVAPARAHGEPGRAGRSPLLSYD